MGVRRDTRGVGAANGARPGVGGRTAEEPDRYDYVAVGEAPSDEAAAAYALALAGQGNVSTLSMKAFTLEEMGAIVAKLP
jgi:uncharacterized protein with GYD domain